MTPLHTLGALAKVTGQFADQSGQRVESITRQEYERTFPGYDCNSLGLAEPYGLGVDGAVACSIPPDATNARLGAIHWWPDILYASETGAAPRCRGVWVDGNHVIASLAELFEEQNAEILCLA